MNFRAKTYRELKEEIEKIQSILSKTKSTCLQRDYEKYLKRLKSQLRKYPISKNECEL